MAILCNLAIVNIAEIRQNRGLGTADVPQWAYNHFSGMKTLRLMEAGRLG
jgi:hypothetical protein